MKSGRRFHVMRPKSKRDDKLLIELIKQHLFKGALSGITEKDINNMESIMIDFTYKI